MFDTIVIGAGQSGLAAGYTLQKAGLHFVLLEAGSSPTGSWPQYYESLTLFSPARFSSLPELPFSGDPDRYPQRDEVIAYLQSYAHHFQFPIHLHTRVQRVQRRERHFRVETTTGKMYEALSIIVATGAFHHPHLPQETGEDLFRGQILHSAVYRRPEPFAGQRIVVVGAGNSAIQIAVELASVAQVSLTSRRPIQFFPQQPLGQDIHFWLDHLGLDQLVAPSFWQQMEINPVFDAGRYQHAIAMEQPDWRPLFQRLTREGVVWMDGREEAVDSILLATGYRFHLDYLQDLEVWDPQGQVRQQEGRSLTVPGLYYLGQNFQRTFASATLRGVASDTVPILDHLQQHIQQSRSSQEKSETFLSLEKNRKE